MNLRLIKGWFGSFLFKKIKFRTIVAFKKKKKKLFMVPNFIKYVEMW